MNFLSKTFSFHHPDGISRLILALLVPAAAFVLQWFSWSAIQPLVWFFFYPAIFFSAWIDGLRGGVAATVLSTVAVWWFFIPQRFSFAFERPESGLAIGFFFGLGVLFALAHEKFRKAQQQKADALRVLQSTNSQLEERVKDRTAELARTIETLREREQDSRAMFEQAAVGMARIAIDGRWVAVNQRFCDIVGYPRKELIKLKFQDLTHPDDLKTSLAIIEQLQAGDIDSGTWEKRYICKQGDIIWVNLSLSLIRGAEGEPTYFISAVQDITKRKRAEADRERLLTAIEQSSEMIVITDPNGAIEYANPVFERTTGYSLDEMRGQNPSLLKSGEHDQAFYRDLWDTIRQGQTWHGHMVNRKKDGTTYTEEATISPVFDEKGSISRYIAVKRDISNQVRSQQEKEALSQQLLHAQKLELVGRLAGGIAHDFNNLLVPILGFADLLLGQLDPKDRQYRPVRQILEAGERARVLAQRLLAFSRKQQLDKRATNINQVIESMSHLLRSSLRESIDLKLGLDPHLQPIMADPGQMEQVLMNLVVNARDAIGFSGVITIQTRTIELTEEAAQSLYQAASGRYSVVSVLDSGCGMDRTVLEHIFDPFFTTKGLVGGTGLGLASVYGIVKQHGGYIKAESQLGHGSLFECYFPVTMQPEHMEGKPALGKDLASFGGHETILVAEDDPSVRTLVVDTLQSIGYQVQDADNCEMALKLATTSPKKIDLLLSDMVMPKMTGLELADKIASSQPGCHVIIMSGYFEGDPATTQISEHHYHLLRKPFTARELAAYVRQTLDGNQGAGRLR